MDKTLAVQNVRNLKRRTEHYRGKDITGFKIGRLTVLAPTDKRDSKGTVVWRCRCDCGNEVEISYDRLLYGRYYSCGCLKEEMRKDLTVQVTRVDNTALEWLKNRKYRKDNTSGFRGVVQRKNGNYLVNIGFKQKRYYLGTYDTYEEAVQARLEAEDMIHGGFLRACKRAGITKGPKDEDYSTGIVFEVKKGDGFIEIESSDTIENGSRMEFGNYS